MRILLAAGAALLLGTLAVSAQQGRFCGGADTSGNCSASPSTPNAVIDPQIDSGTTATIPNDGVTQGLDGTTNRSIDPTIKSQGDQLLRPADPVSPGFADNPIGNDTSIRSQQNRSPSVSSPTSRSIQ